MKLSKPALVLAGILFAVLSSVSAFAAGLPGVEVELLRNKIHHAGVAVMMDFVITNNSNKAVTIHLDANPSENHNNVTADGDTYSLAGAGKYNGIVVPAGESVKKTLYVDNFPYNIKQFDSIKLMGRSSVTSKNNPYGEFNYVFKDVEIPSFPNSNKNKCFFLDTEFEMSVDKIAANGNDLEVLVSLTNNGKRNKRVSCTEKGKATDNDGDEYEVKDSQQYMYTDIASGESENVKVIVVDGAKRDFKKIRVMYNVNEVGGDNLSYPVLLQLDGLSSM